LICGCKSKEFQINNSELGRRFFIPIYLSNLNLKPLPKLIFTVTNDLNYDQRMQRICNSLSKNGFQVNLVGRKLKYSIPLQKASFQQKRLYCFFNKGFLFYAEFNLRLFIHLLFAKFDVVCAIDADTVLPCYFASLIKRRKRVYDAHELFSEQKEIITRKKVHFIWLMIERWIIPKFKYGYTVNESIQNELTKRYQVNYSIIRNLPLLYSKFEIQNLKLNEDRFILYQGAVNEGRCFETLIPAMKDIDCKLMICGNGNFYRQLIQLIKENKVEDKIILKDTLLPDELHQLTPTATIGLTLFEAKGFNQIYSLSNRFFDYIMAEIPQICVGFPEYKRINDEFDIAILIDNTTSTTISQTINNLLDNAVIRNRLSNNCKKVKEILNWETEEIKLLTFWKNICTL